jgi:hypothetical protein
MKSPFLQRAFLFQTNYLCNPKYLTWEWIEIQ